ncbi:MAG: hypothetical protein ABW168_04690 [Sedimenticola sp.]
MDRRADVIITRLRLDHNGLDANNFANKEETPKCRACHDEDEPETLMHFLYHCPALAKQRKVLSDTILKLNITDSIYTLLFPPQDKENEVYHALLQYIKAGVKYKINIHPHSH